LNTEVVTVTGFADMTPVIEVSYDYVVTSVDANGVESVPSNVYTAAIP
jgi:fibronectin type 3 domain-containing protein